MKQIKVAFLFQVPSFWPSWEYLINQMSRDERFQIKIFWVNGKAGDRAQMYGASRFLVNKNIKYDEYTHEKIILFNPKYIFYQTPYDSGHRDTDAWSIRYKILGIKIVYIPYGIEISDTWESHYKHFALPVVLNADEIFTMSESMKLEYEKYCINSEHVKATGLTRFDSLVKGFPILDVVREKAQGRPIVLWKVHFPKVFVEHGIKKQATPELSEYLKFSEWIGQEEDLFFVFMPHPKFSDSTVIPELRYQAIELINKLESSSNVYIDKSADYRNSLLNSDAIIVDRSAVMIEAGLRGVPVLYMYNENYEEPMTPPIQRIVDSYYNGSTCKDMIAFCDNFKKGIDVRYKERIAAYKENVAGIDGKVCERVRDILVKDADIKPKVNKLKRHDKIVIFGTGELGQMCLAAFNAANVQLLEILALVDNNSKKWNTQIDNYRVCNPKELKEMDYDFVVIASDKYYREMFLQLTNDLDVSKKKIIGYDQFIIQCKYKDVME